MSAAWWIRRGTVEDGPFTVDQLKRMASNGNLDRNGRIRLGKTTQWVEPQRMDWLQEYFESTPQKVTSETVAAPVSPSDENATPWYVYAAIGMGAVVMLAVLVLILIGHQKNGNELSGSLTAANESIGNNGLEENGVSKVVGDQDKPPVMPGVGEGGTAKSGEEEGKADLPGDSDPHPEGSTTSPATVPAPVSDDKQTDTGSTDSSEPVVSKSPSDAAVSDVAVPIEPVDVDLPVGPFVKVITRVDPGGAHQRGPAPLEGRSEEMRRELVRKSGGNEQSEQAVGLALDWLAAHQEPDGGWNFDHTIGPCAGRCSHAGTLQAARNGATAMALLPFLGAGQKHQA